MARAQDYSNRLVAVFNPDRLGHQHEFPSGQATQTPKFNSPAEINVEHSLGIPEDQLLSASHFDSTLSAISSPSPKRRRGSDKRPAGSASSKSSKKSDTGASSARANVPRSSSRDDRHPLSEIDANSPVKRHNLMSKGGTVDIDTHLDYTDGKLVLEDVSKFDYTDIDLDLNPESL